MVEESVSRLVLDIVEGAGYFVGGGVWMECEPKREAGARGSDIQRSLSSNIICKEKAQAGQTQDGGPLGMSFETSFISIIDAKLPQVAGLVVGCLPDVSQTKMFPYIEH
jgi:hypothetical protein